MLEVSVFSGCLVLRYDIINETVRQLQANLIYFSNNTSQLTYSYNTVRTQLHNHLLRNSLLIGETISTNAKLIANNFHTFFTSVAAKLNEKVLKAKKPFSHYHGQITDETIFLYPTTPADIKSLTNCVKRIKAIGPNSIPTKILKEFNTIKRYD